MKRFFGHSRKEKHKDTGKGRDEEEEHTQKPQRHKEQADPHSSPAVHRPSDTATSSTPPAYNTPTLQSNNPYLVHQTPLYAPPQQLPPAYPSDNLPPPPSLGHETSPTTNAPESLAAAGYDFCTTHPLPPPNHFPPSALSAIAAGKISFAPPPPPPHSGFRGSISTSETDGTTKIFTEHGCKDTTLLSHLPLYAAAYHHPSTTSLGKKIYFEVTISSLPSTGDQAAIAIGFSAIPYPPFRLPGWHRGSWGVHSDDGRRYCNDSFGGKEFAPVGFIKAGDVWGVGMSFPLAASSAGGTGGGGGPEAFVTRNGEWFGGWRVFEERDGEMDEDSTVGLDGGADVYAAVGIWGAGVEVSVRFFGDGAVVPGVG